MSEREADIYGDMDEVSNISSCDIENSAPDSGLEIVGTVEHEAHDLYDDIYSFETRREREQAAEIKKLHEDLHNVTKKLAAEESQNQILRRNLESLLVTARTELSRKGAEIKELQRTIIRYQTGKRLSNEVPSAKSGWTRSIQTSGGTAAASRCGSVVSSLKPVKTAATTTRSGVLAPLAKPASTADVRLPLLPSNASNEQERKRCVEPTSNERMSPKCNNSCGVEVSAAVIGNSSLDAAVRFTSHSARGRGASNDMDTQVCSQPVNDSVSSLADGALVVNRTGDSVNAAARFHHSKLEAPVVLAEGNSHGSRVPEHAKESMSMVQQPAPQTSNKLSEGDLSSCSGGPCLSRGLSLKCARSSPSSEASRAHASTLRSSALSPSIGHRQPPSGSAASLGSRSTRLTSNGRAVQSRSAEDVDRRARQRGHSPAHPSERGVSSRILPRANEPREMRDAADRECSSGNVSSNRPQEVSRSREPNSRETASSREVFPAERAGPDRARESQCTPKGLSPHFVDEGSARRQHRDERRDSYESREREDTTDRRHCLANRNPSSIRHTSGVDVSKDNVHIRNRRYDTAYDKEPARICTTNADEHRDSRDRESRNGVACKNRSQARRSFDLTVSGEGSGAFYDGRSYSRDVSHEHQAPVNDVLADQRDRRQHGHRASRDELVQSGDSPGTVPHLAARRSETADRDSDKHSIRNSQGSTDREPTREEHAMRRPNRMSPAAQRGFQAPSHRDCDNRDRSKTIGLNAERMSRKRPRADIEDGEVLSE